jgi:hypothetical protein
VTPSCQAEGSCRGRDATRPCYAARRPFPLAVPPGRRQPPPPTESPAGASLLRDRFGRFAWRGNAARAGAATPSHCLPARRSQAPDATRMACGGIRSTTSQASLGPLRGFRAAWVWRMTRDRFADPVASGIFPGSGLCDPLLWCGFPLAASRCETPALIV